MLNQLSRMMLTKFITLSPQCCEKDHIHKNIEEKIVSTYCEKYSKDYGYIKSIKDIQIVQCIKLFSNGYAKFEVNYNILFLKPCLQNVYKATVFLISDERKAIMCHIDNIFNILVEMSNLKTKNIKPDDIIDIKVTDVEYNCTYNTIGIEV
jgi:DNA-directed RNA polymerase subunit E'/Rpb7